VHVAKLTQTVVTWAMATALFAATACSFVDAPVFATTETTLPPQQSERADVFPRIAMYWLGSRVDAAAELVMAHSDVVVMNPEVGVSQPEVLSRLRAKRPDLELLAYIGSEELGQAAELVQSGAWTGVLLDACFGDGGAVIDELRVELGPDVPIVGSTGSQDCEHPDLDGILLEGWPSGLPDGSLDFDVGLQRYLAWSKSDRRPLTIANAHSPRIGSGKHAPGADEEARTDWAAMRFGLATALMGDGLFAFDDGVLGHDAAWWYDEYDGAGRGRGWLGRPLGAMRDLGAGVLLREFEGGVAIVNSSDSPRRMVMPDGLFKLRGAQDPVHNDGAPVRGTLLVPARDAYLLAR
jgi:hypothetical protein